MENRTFSFHDLLAMFEETFDGFNVISPNFDPSNLQFGGPFYPVDLSKRAPSAGAVTSTFAVDCLPP
jgi:hypothetical protein